MRIRTLSLLAAVVLLAALPAAAQPIFADFSYSPSNPVAGQVVQFVDQSSGGPNLWYWDFGDRTSSNLPNPTKVWSSPGSYDVTLQVSNASGTASTTKTVKVSGGSAPVAQFNYSPSTPVAGLPVLFTDLSTGGPVSWAWDFGDGTTDTDQSPEHYFYSPGTFTVRLTVRNSYGSNTTQRTVNVTRSGGSGPKSAFGWTPSNPGASQPVTFQDQSTGSPTDWLWSFGDQTTSSQRNPTKSYSSPGTYYVTLQVWNSSGSDSLTKTITVGPRQPAPVASFTYSPSSPTAGQTVQFADTSSGGPSSWAWDFGDGSTSPLQNPNHIYTRAGSFTVQLRATNTVGSDTAQRTITVSAVPGFSAWLPVAVHATGAYGSQYRTDVAVLNQGSSPTQVEIRLYLPAGPKSTALSLLAGAETVLEDVVFQLSSADGSGPVEIRSDMPVSVMSRTYNISGSGTAGSGFPAYLADQILAAGQSGGLPFLREDASFRTNIGLTNTSASPASVSVNLYDGTGRIVGSYTTTLGAYQWDQKTQPFLNIAGQSSLPRAWARIQVNSGTGVLAYATVLDNVSNDPTTVYPTK